MSKPDGGSAFPRVESYRSGDTGRDEVGTFGGMSLRDYLAAKAMAALIDGYDHEIRCASHDSKKRTGFDDQPWPDGSDDSTWASQLAGEAYLIADAMLLARADGIQ
jgi:hypothetical protein